MLECSSRYNIGQSCSVNLLQRLLDHISQPGKQSIGGLYPLNYVFQSKDFSLVQAKNRNTCLFKSRDQYDNKVKKTDRNTDVV